MNPISFSGNIVHSPNGIGIIGTGKSPVTELLKSTLKGKDQDDVDILIIDELAEKIKKLEQKGIKIIIVDSGQQDTIDIKKLKESIGDRLKDIKTVNIKDHGRCIADNTPPKRDNYPKPPHPNSYLVQNNLKSKPNPHARFYKARSTPKKVK
ncbi:MAG: hypothetical protein A2Y25_10495 [Candidatus Melainabacteria bacterium GWF2_37_15]|nr:MAG: hypothetical protein A2Y25_10495 [Candidatus Melainabacteria bacterium GWF2_37_15]